MKLRLPRPLSLFLLTILLVILGLALRIGLPIYKQQMAIRQVRRLGGEVEVRMNGPKWLSDRLPDCCKEALGSVWQVDLQMTDVTDADLTFLRTFPNVLELSLSDSQVTDGGLQQLSELRRLETLMLANTRVTVAGLEHLRRLPRLRTINAVHSGVTREANERFHSTRPPFHVYIGKSAVCMRLTRRTH
jgi:hypothetical protein